MKYLVLSIAGSGLSITGALIFIETVISKVDWQRVKTYGLFHELGATTPIVVIGIVLIAAGVLSIIVALVKALRSEDK